MKISELNQPYRDLALMRREQKPRDTAFLGFTWSSTPEEGNFWNSVDEGYNPEIPASSMKELEEWRKANGIPVENENSDDMCFHECPNCNDRCYCSAQPCSCCTQDEPDYKAMYEQLKKDHEELACEYEEYLEANKPIKFTDRNYMMECAMAAMQGFLSNETKLIREEDTRFIDAFPPVIARLSFDFAEAMISEGKKRGHI